MDIRKKFPPGARLKRTAEFENVYKNGSRIAKPNLVILFHPNSSGQSRLGVVASRKIGKVSDRNLIKRRFREIFRHHRYKLKSGYDLIFIARKSALSAYFEQLEDDIIKSFSEINNKINEKI